MVKQSVKAIFESSFVPPFSFIFLSVHLACLKLKITHPSLFPLLPQSYQVLVVKSKDLIGLGEEGAGESEGCNGSMNRTGMQNVAFSHLEITIYIISSR